MLGSYWIHHSRVACCQVSKDRKLIVYFFSVAQMMNPLKFVALLGAALWLFAGANIFRVVVGDRRSQVFVNFFGRLIRSSGTGYMLYLYPSHETKYEVHGLGRKIQHLHACFKLFSNGNPTPNHSESLAIRVRIVGIEEKAGSGVTLRFGFCPIDFMT